MRNYGEIEMKIIKTEQHVLLKNKLGEYHLSHEEFNSLGRDEAVKLAEKEINKKANSSFSGETINFKQASALGFCSYGIKDFADMLKIDVDGEYTIQELNEKLTIDALKEYPDECIKLFGKNTLKYLGGVEGVLSEETVSLVLRKEFIFEKTLHLLSVRFAYSCLENFEKEYPEDKRPRKAIGAKEAWIRGDINDEQLYAAHYAAGSAASAAAGSAACYDASAAAGYAARAAASAAAHYAAHYAARSAARSAAEKGQVQMILEELTNQELKEKK